MWGAGGDIGGTNVVWGTECGGHDCSDVVWDTADPEDTTVWATSDGDENDNIVWGTADAAEDVIWSPPAMRRPKRILAVTDDAGLA